MSEGREGWALRWIKAKGREQCTPPWHANTHTLHRHSLTHRETRPAYNAPRPLRSLPPPSLVFLFSLSLPHSLLPSFILVVVVAGLSLLPPNNLR